MSKPYDPDEQVKLLLHQLEASSYTPVGGKGLRLVLTHAMALLPPEMTAIETWRALVKESAE